MLMRGCGLSVCLCGAAGLGSSSSMRERVSEATILKVLQRLRIFSSSGQRSRIEAGIESTDSLISACTLQSSPTLKARSLGKECARDSILPLRKEAEDMLRL